MSSTTSRADLRWVDLHPGAGGLTELNDGTFVPAGYPVPLCFHSIPERGDN